MTLRSIFICINIIFLLIVDHLNASIIDIDDDLCSNSVVKLSDLNGVLTSPPPSINRNFTCDWYINVPDDYKLSLFFTYLDLTDDCKTRGSSLTIQSVDEDRGTTTSKSSTDRVLYDNCKNNGKLSIVANQNIDLITNKISVRYSHSNGSRNQGFKLIYHTYRQLDENKSEQKCKNDEFKCINENKCILNKFYCNCYVNCLNSSDEISCSYDIIESNCNFNNNNANISSLPSTQNCPYSNQIWCINRDTKQASCFHEDLIRCNGKYDCFNYVNDELNCDYSMNNNNNEEINPDFSVDDTSANSYCSDPYRLDRVGWISSPNYRKSTYPDMLNCTYHIVVDVKSQIQIRFKDIYLRSYTVKTGKNTYDIDFISIYDGDSIYSPLLARITYENNNRRNIDKAIDSRSNRVLIVFHTVKLNDSIKQYDTINTYGYNLTYQVKGECLPDQRSCNDMYSQYPSPIKPEYNCYDPTEQRCDNKWDCHNGADELLCPTPSSTPCPIPTFSCRNGASCYHYADRCDGDSQCTDKSDELNCDSWLCNSQNGTFLCANKRCIYEQWVCDGTNDCDDGSDEMNCPTPFTRRVITTAVLGGTLCCLLLVMALGCACKLYTLRTIEYRTNLRLAASARRARQQRQQQQQQQQQQHSSTSASSSSSRSRRRPFSVFRRNQSSPPQQTSAAAAATNTNDNSTASLIRSASTSSLDYNNLIAPPTYNQTMGLVDEYEQRQIAFIEHMRSIINSNNATSNGGATSSGVGVGVGVTSTQNGSHRTSSRSTRRRSHSSRHGGSSGVGGSSNTETINPSDQQQQQQQQSSGSSSSSSGRQHRRRHHRHHHRHNHHYYHHHHGHCPTTTTAATTGSSSNPTAAVTYMPHNRVYNDLDMNRMSTSSRNLQTLIPAPTLMRQSASTSSSILMPQQLTQNNLNNVQSSSSLQPITNNASAATTTTTTATTTKSTNNLKDRIAKLIKDIVNHGDNIQYMQLSDTRSQQNNSIIQMQHHQQQQQQPAPQHIQLQQRNCDSQQQQQRSTTTTTDNNCEQKDDVSLIEP